MLLPSFILRVLTVAQVSAWALGFKTAVLDVARAQRSPAIWGTGFQVRVVQDPGWSFALIMSCQSPGWLCSAFIFVRTEWCRWCWVLFMNQVSPGCIVEQYDLGSVHESGLS